MRKMPFSTWGDSRLYFSGSDSLYTLKEMNIAFILNPGYTLILKNGKKYSTMKTLLTLLTIITALNSCTPNHKVVYANYTGEQADSIVNIIDNTALEMQNIEK